MKLTSKKHFKNKTKLLFLFYIQFTIFIKRLYPIMYRVQLKNFEGPLDLLLFFIKRDELNIYDIPISHITHEYLEYIHLMEELDLEVASEFILMASMLMSIKAKLMLPHAESDEDELAEDDPRYELVQKLLEYKRYKEMAEKLTHIDEEVRKKYYRGYTEADNVEKQATGEALTDVTMFDLISAFQKVLTDIKHKHSYHRVEKVSVTVEEQSNYIIGKLQQSGRSSFLEICSGLQTRMEIVVSFLAVLEMLKEQQIALFIEDDPTHFFIDLKPVDEILGKTYTKALNN